MGASEPLRQARRMPSPRMHNVTVYEKRKVNEEQPNPTAVHHTITTARLPDNTRSSALVRSRLTKSMASPSCWPRRRSPETRLHFCHFCGSNFMSVYTRFCFLLSTLAIIPPRIIIHWVWSVFKNERWIGSFCSEASELRAWILLVPAPRAWQFCARCLQETSHVRVLSGSPNARLLHQAKLNGTVRAVPVYL